MTENTTDELTREQLKIAFSISNKNTAPETVDAEDPEEILQGEPTIDLERTLEDGQ